MGNSNRDDRIETKIDKISSDISEINVTLAEQHISLKEHIRRTNVLEEKLIPMEMKFQQFHGIIKLGAWLVTILSAAAALAEIFGYIKHV